MNEENNSSDSEVWKMDDEIPSQKFSRGGGVGGGGGGGDCL